MSDTAKPTLNKGCTVKLWDRANFRYFVSDEAVDVYQETNLTPRQLLERVRELEAEQKALLSTLKAYVSSMQIIHEPGRSEAINAADDAAKNLIARFEDAALAKHGENV